MKPSNSRNYVAKYARQVNRASVHRNRKADQKAGRNEKHKRKERYCPELVLQILGNSFQAQLALVSNR